MRATASPSRCSGPPRCCRCWPGRTATGRPGAGDRARRRHRGGGHPLPMTSPFVSDVPTEQARSGVARGLRGRRLPAAASTPCRCRSATRSAGSPRSRCGRGGPRPAFDSAAMDGIAVRAAATVGAAETTPVLLDDFAVVDTGDPLPSGYDAVVMREHVHHTPDGRAELRAAVPPYQHVRSIGEDISATELLLPAGHRLRPVDVAACAAAGVVELVVRRRPRVVVIPTGDEIRPVGTDLAPGEIADTNSMMLAAQAAEIGCETRTTGIVADDPELITAAVRDGGRRRRPGDPHRGVERRTRRLHRAGGRVRRLAGRARRRRASGHPVVLGTVAGDPATPMPATPILGAPGYPVSAALTFDIFAAPMLAALEGAAPRERPATTARLARKLALGASAPTTGSGSGSARRRRRRGDTPAARGRRADLAGPRRRPPGRAGRGGGHHAGERVRVRAAARARRHRAHDRRDRLARPGARHGRLGAARDRPPAHAGVVERRVAGRAGRAARRAVPPGRLAPARPGHRRVHAAVPRPDLRRWHRHWRRAGRGPAGAPRPGSSGRPRQPAGADRHRRPHRPGLRYVNRQRGAGTRVLLDHELGRLGVDPAAVVGYSREEHTHLGGGRRRRRRSRRHGPGHPGRRPCVRTGLRAGRPRALRPRAAPRVAGGRPVLAPLWALLEQPDFRADVEKLGGYSCAETGRRIR